MHSSVHLFPVLGSVFRALNPDSPQTRLLLDLGRMAGMIFAGIFVIVAGVIVYSLMRYRGREGEPDPHQIAGNTRAEMIWTLIPCVIVAVLFALTARTMSLADPPPAPEPDLIVTGHQWWWEARYAKSGAVTANEFHVPVGKAFCIQLESADVLHELWVPELARKITAVPGHPNHLWLQADHAGTYVGMCSEFCGSQHAWMHFMLVAEPAAEFTAWEDAQQQPAPKPVSDAAARGLALFRQKTCVNCHTIHGVSADTHIGPDLTHFAGRRQFGAGIADNTPGNLRRWLTNPQQIKPGCLMPDFHLSDADAQNLAAYLETLK